MRWNDRDRWVWSERPTHEVIVSLEHFEAAHAVFELQQRPRIRKERTRHPYVLSGLVRCGLCDRKMQASWNHGKAYYRCKFPAE